MAMKGDIRRIALSFDGVSEIDHWGRPAFRTKKRIFAVVRPDGLNLNLPEERKEFLFAAAPSVFVRQTWGRKAILIAQYENIPKPELALLLREAYEHSGPADKKVADNVEVEVKAETGVKKTAAKKPARKRKAAKA
jgi:hypothetical protein